MHLSLIAAWAEKLQSSSALQQVLRTPPEFGALNQKHAEVHRRAKKSGAPAPHQYVGDLTELVVQGIPTTLKPRAVEVDAESPVYLKFGGAFEGGEEELSLLSDTSTAIPHVKVIDHTLYKVMPFSNAPLVHFSNALLEYFRIPAPICASCGACLESVAPEWRRIVGGREQHSPSFFLLV